MITDNPLIKKLLTLDLPKEDYAIFGSGPMAAHGIKDLGRDVDLIARGKAWEKACELGTPQEANLSDNKVVELFDGEIEIFNGWAPGEWDPDTLIDGAEEIEGLRFVTLSDVIKWKEMMGREKDFQHIAMIEEYFEHKQDLIEHLS